MKTLRSLLSCTCLLALVLSGFQAAHAQSFDVLETADLNQQGDLANGDANSNVAGNVVLDGDLLAARIWDSGSWAVRILRESGESWGVESTVTSPSPGLASTFGADLSLHLDTLAIGETRETRTPSENGSCQIWRRAPGGTWNLEQTVVASDGTAGDSFGVPALDGDRLLVGAATEDTGANDNGAGYIFERTGSTWTEVAKLQPSLPQNIARLGTGVELRGDLAFLLGRITCLVFREVTPGTWTEEATILGPDVLGVSVAFDGQTLALAQKLGGRAFLFENIAQAWTLVSIVRTSIPVPLTYLSSDTQVDVDAGRLIIGTRTIENSQNRRFVGAWVAERGPSGWPTLADPLSTRPPTLVSTLPHNYIVSDVAVNGDRYAAVLPRRKIPLVNRSGTVMVFEEAEFPPAEFCFGSDTVSGCAVCPCGNASPAANFAGCVCSAGTAPRLYVAGVAKLSFDTLRFDLRRAIPDSFAILLSGDQQLPAIGPCPPGSGILGTPPLDGLRCIGSNLIRHGVRPLDFLGGTSSSWGNVDPLTPNGLIAQSSPTAGQTRHWQSFFRDDAMGGCGTGLGTSQGISVTFAP